MIESTPANASGDAEARAVGRVDQRRALSEMSVRLWAISQELGDSRTDVAELCEDAHELEAVARHIRSLTQPCWPSA
jgi:hypothetical protein